MIFHGSSSKSKNVGKAESGQKKGHFQSATNRIFARFFPREDGSLVVFTLFLFVVMLMVGGVAVDTIRHETQRTKLQYTLDRAVLAAADLEQTVAPQTVIDDYFAKAGFPGHPVNVVVTEQNNARRVDASLTGSIDTLFMNMFGVNSIPVPAGGAAGEGIMDLEISLVLDVSGSMNSNNRLNLLKTAAKDFVDAVIDGGGGPEDVSISIIPFATQVNAGPLLIDEFNVSNEHDYSHCVTFKQGDFSTTALTTTEPLDRTGHFAPWETGRTPSDNDYVCYPATHRQILPWSHDPIALKAKIDSFVARGNTSIDVGTKWGTALLDPSTSSVLSNLVASNDVHADFSGRPFAYVENNVLKVLVVMSDGQNTNQYYINEPYRDGLSDIWLDANNAGTSDDDWSIYNTGRDDYYHHDSQSTHNYPDGDPDAVQLTYPQVFDNLSVYWWSRYLKRPGQGGTTQSWRNAAYNHVPPNQKNARTSNICRDARDQGILVFTIGMETYGQGDATLLDCASSAAHFYDVDGVEISEAFSSIATTINQLRLLQ